MGKGKFKFRPKRFLIIFGSIIAFFAVLIFVQIPFNPYWDSLMFKSSAPPLASEETLTRAQALADLKYLFDIIQKDHPVYLNVGLASQWETYDNECAALSENPTVQEVERAARRICSILNDGHTSVWSEQTTRYLLNTWKHNDAGEILTAVNGETLEQMFERCKTLFSYEMESYGMRSMKDLLSSVSGLALLGIDVADGVTLTYKTPEGEQANYSYTDADYLSYDEIVAYYGDRSSADDEFVSYEIDKEKSLAILTLDECVCDSTYLSVINAMFAEVKALGIKNVAVDLRENGGGNSWVANEFIRYLDVDTFSQGTYWQRFGRFTKSFDDTVTVNERHTELLFTGKVFVLTSTRTFSSAMLFAEFIMDNGLGTVIGETAGNMPKSYGEIATFQMPNSRLFFCVSTKKFNRIDVSKSSLPLTPDVECPGTEALERLYELLV